MPVQQYLYEFDGTGLLAANKVVAEVKSVITVASPNIAFIVPRAAPFYAESFKMYRGGNLAAKIPQNLMVEGDDYQLTHHYVEASMAVGKQIYGSATFLKGYTGQVVLEYQTVGGSWVLDDYSVIESLTRSLYNVFTVTWDQVFPLVPNAPPPDIRFPPVAHPQNVADTTGWIDLINKWEEIRQTIIDTFGDQSALLNALNDHLIAPTAHGKQQVGLSDVQNFGLASQVEAEAGLVHNKYMTPLRVAQALAAIGVGSLATPRTIALINDVIGSVNFDGSANVNIASTLADRFKLIENANFTNITGGSEAQDPNASIFPFFFTKHNNCPDNSGAYYWFILNMGQGSSLGSITRRSQIAVEWNNTQATTAVRMAVRQMNTSSTWGAWQWTSNHRDMGLADGRRYGSPYVDGFNVGTDADVDNILETFCRITIASENLNGLSRGNWMMQTYFDNDAGLLPTVTTNRVQIATSVVSPNTRRDKQYMRTYTGTWSAWRRMDSNGGAILDDINIDTVVNDGPYRQKDAATILDLTSRGYPVQDDGVLVVYGCSDALDVGTRQTYYPASDLSVYQRRQLTNTPTWSAWSVISDATGNITVDRLPVVDIAHGGTGGTTPAAARTNLELQNGAITNFIVSPTEPVAPPANTIWLKPVV